MCSSDLPLWLPHLPMQVVFCSIAWRATKSSHWLDAGADRRLPDSRGVRQKIAILPLPFRQFYAYLISARPVPDRMPCITQ